MTKQECGKLIAYWNRAATKADLKACRDLVRNALRANGLNFRYSVRVADMGMGHCQGHDRITATITIPTPIDKIRDIEGNTVKGLSKITIWFKRNAGLFDIEKHQKRHTEEAAIFDKMGDTPAALAAIDALPWDGEVCEFNLFTNGHIREYRKRHFYGYEPRGSFCYDADFAALADPLYSVFHEFAVNLGYGAKFDNSKGKIRLRKNAA